MAAIRLFGRLPNISRPPNTPGSSRCTRATSTRVSAGSAKLPRRNGRKRTTRVTVGVFGTIEAIRSVPRNLVENDSSATAVTVPLKERLRPHLRAQPAVVPMTSPTPHLRSQSPPTRGNRPPIPPPLSRHRCSLRRCLKHHLAHRGPRPDHTLESLPLPLPT